MTKPKTEAQKQASKDATEWLVLTCGCHKPSQLAGARYVRNLKSGCLRCGMRMEVRRVGDALQKAFAGWADPQPVVAG